MDDQSNARRKYQWLMSSLSNQSWIAVGSGQNHVKSCQGRSRVQDRDRGKPRRPDIPRHPIAMLIKAASVRQQQCLQQRPKASSKTQLTPRRHRDHVTLPATLNHGPSSTPVHTCQGLGITASSFLAGELLSSSSTHSVSSLTPPRLTLPPLHNRHPRPSHRPNPHPSSSHNNTRSSASPKS